MSQEMNKKAVADLFCIEDARAVCEAIGGLGLTGNEPTDEPLEYTPDNILDVTVNENPDGMPAFPQVGQTDMDDETKAFVVDELAKQLQADGRESLTEEDLIPFAVKIKGENHIAQDLVPFIDQLISGNNARLSTQNTSEAQPNGVATDLTNGGEGSPDATAPAPAPEAAPAPGMEAPVPGADTLPPEAPGGLAEPTESPALDTNTDDGLGAGAVPAADGDFNLDVPEPGTEVGPAAGSGADEFNLDVPGAEGEAGAADNVDNIGELDFGDTNTEPSAEGSADGGATSEEDDLFSALDGMSDDTLDGGDDDSPAAGDAGSKASEGNEENEKPDDGKKDDEKPAETESIEGAASPVTECGDSVPPVTECGDSATPVTDNGDSVPPVTECGEGTPAATECSDGAPAKMESAEDGHDAHIDAQLESIKANYVESMARERVRAVVESYEKQRALAEKQALCESIIADYQSRKEVENRSAVVESTLSGKLGELGDKLAAMCESSNGQNDVDAKLEAIVNQFKANKANEAEAKALDAKLESITKRYAAGKQVDDKLAAIVESVKGHVEQPSEPKTQKSGLDAKLEAIIADAKKNIAAAK